MRVAVVIPALNEAGCIGDLVREVCMEPVHQVIVVDNGSSDDTASIAERAGARVVYEPRRGYGYACAAGVAAADRADVVVFLDGDFSFLPNEMPRLLAPLQEGSADLVLGSRTLGHIAPDAMPRHQRQGNWIAARLIRILWGVPLTDLGPYRAIRQDLLNSLGLREMTFGWPTEMIVKAARQRARITEAPVSYQTRRGGTSKVGGTWQGSLLAAYKILSVTFGYTGSTSTCPKGAEKR